MESEAGVQGTAAAARNIRVRIYLLASWTLSLQYTLLLCGSKAGRYYLASLVLSMHTCLHPPAVFPNVRVIEAGCIPRLSPIFSRACLFPAPRGVVVVHPLS